MITVHEALAVVTHKIKSNLKTDANPHGVLVQREKDYLKSVSVQHRELENLFREDEAYWSESLQKAK